MDENIRFGKTDRCQTFNNPPLCASGDFEIRVLEVYGFVGAWTTSLPISPQDTSSIVAHYFTTCCTTTLTASITTNTIIKQPKYSTLYRKLSDYLTLSCYASLCCVVYVLYMILFLSIWMCAPYPRHISGIESGRSDTSHYFYFLYFNTVSFRWLVSILSILCWNAPSFGEAQVQIPT